MVHLGFQGCWIPDDVRGKRPPKFPLLRRIEFFGMGLAEKVYQKGDDCKELYGTATDKTADCCKNQRHKEQHHDGNHLHFSMMGMKLKMTGVPRRG
ncbi:hypothetical protein R1flu_017175 [Riccia fluitans]|uniref:Uncharacterized protein n=1 Tax=Riccia fluitans TaxID=41844 RepID=A0ABD1XEK8_9MARC